MIERGRSSYQYERLKDQIKCKEFINIASHEMKTPTQAILGFSNLLETHPEKKMEINQGIKEMLPVAKTDK